MKLLNTLLILTFTFILISCGGANYTENAVLGKVPSAFIEMKKEIIQLQSKEESREKYKKKVEKCVDNTISAVKKDMEKLEGKDIPFSMTYDDPYYYIESITVDKVSPRGIGGGSDATIIMTMKIRAKQDIEDFIALPTLCYINMTNDETKYIDKGTIDPFYRGQVSGYTMQTNFIKNKGVKGGELFNEEGSIISFAIAYYDYTDFKEIRFVSPEEFKAYK